LKASLLNAWPLGSLCSWDVSENEAKFVLVNMMQRTFMSIIYLFSSAATL